MTSEAVERLKRFRAFSGDVYRTLNPDVGRADVDPYEHAITFGALEGRRLFSLRTLAQAWGTATSHATRAGAGSDDVGRSIDDVRWNRDLKLMVLVSSFSTAQDHLLAAALKSLVTRTGLDVAIGDERTRISSDAVHVVVAPHVFYYEGCGPAWRLSGLVRNGFVLNTADVQTQDFERALPFLIASRGLIDLAPQLVTMFGDCGVPAHLFPPCRLTPDEDAPRRGLSSALARSIYLPDLETDAAGDDWTRRPLDCFFLGDNSHRRSQVFGRLAGRLADQRNFIYLAQGFQDRVERTMEHRDWAHVFARTAMASKMMLAVARDELLPVDWGAVYHAMACGSVVIADGALDHPRIEAGTHVFASNARYMPEMIAWLRDSADGRAAAGRARAACARLLDAAEMAASASLAAFLGLCLARERPVGP